MHQQAQKYYKKVLFSFSIGVKFPKIPSNCTSTFMASVRMGPQKKTGKHTETMETKSAFKGQRFQYVEGIRANAATDLKALTSAQFQRTFKK